jgi:hypothetical protein
MVMSPSATMIGTPHTHNGKRKHPADRCLRGPSNGLHVRRIPMLRPRISSRTQDQTGGASHSGATAHLRFHLTFHEGEQIGVYLFGFSDCYTVSTTGVNFQNCVRDDRWYAAAGWTDRHDLVVFAVNDE